MGTYQARAQARAAGVGAVRSGRLRRSWRAQAVSAMPTTRSERSMHIYIYRRIDNSAKTQENLPEAKLVAALQPSIVSASARMPKPAAMNHERCLGMAIAVIP